MSEHSLLVILRKGFYMSYRYAAENLDDRPAKEWHTEERDIKSQKLEYPFGKSDLIFNSLTYLGMGLFHVKFVSCM